MRGVRGPGGYWSVSHNLYSKRESLESNKFSPQKNKIKHHAVFEKMFSHVGVPLTSRHELEKKNTPRFVSQLNPRCPEVRVLVLLNFVFLSCALWTVRSYHVFRRCWKTDTFICHYFWGSIPMSYKFGNWMSLLSRIGNFFFCPTYD